MVTCADMHHSPVLTFPRTSCNWLEWGYGGDIVKWKWQETGMKKPHFNVAGRHNCNADDMQRNAFVASLATMHHR